MDSSSSVLPGEIDIEKAQAASSTSSLSQGPESLPSTESGVFKSEHEENEATQKHSFLSRKVLSIFSPMMKLWREYRAGKELQKQILEEMYSKLKTGPPIIKDYPPGWPQLAALLNSEPNFAIYRRYGMLHCRILVQLQAELHILEQQLHDLDKADHEAGPGRSWRLQKADVNEYRAPCHAKQRVLRRKIEEKLLVYDQLLLNDQRLRELGPARKTDHLSFYHWICQKTPLGEGQFDWVYEQDDFVPVSKLDRFESSIINSFFKKPFRTSPSPSVPNDLITHYSTPHITTFLKLLNVLWTVSILVIPIFVLLWIPETQTRAWIAATVLVSVLGFCVLMSVCTEAKVQDVLVGTAAYCAVLATFLGNMPVRP